MAKNEDGLSAFERATLDEQRRHNAAIEAMHAASATPLPVVDGSPTAKFNAMVMDLKGQIPGIPHAPEPYVIVGCRSHKTDATFDMKIDPRGNKTLELLNYTLDDRFDRSVDQGGLVPNGFSTTPPHNSHWKQWKFEFWKADINEYVGKAFPEWMRPKPPPVAEVA
jgi:hypothetical protein